MRRYQYIIVSIVAVILTAIAWVSIDVAAAQITGQNFSKFLHAVYAGSSAHAPIRMDASTHSLQFIDYAHHELHSGSSFHAWIYDEGAASGETIEMQFTTPATPLIHLVVTHIAVNKHLYCLKEAATYSSGGATSTAINRRRDAGASTLINFREGSDKGGNNIVTGGSPVTLEEIWTGSRGAVASSRGAEEFVLKASTQYLVQMEAKEAASLLFLGIDWYEHSDRN